MADMLPWCWECSRFMRLLEAETDICGYYGAFAATFITVYFEHISTRPGSILVSYLSPTSHYEWNSLYVGRPMR